MFILLTVLNFIASPLDDDVNLSILERVKMIAALQDDEQFALIKMNYPAISNKKIKDSLKTKVD